jgi:TolB protein
MQNQDEAPDADIEGTPYRMAHRARSMLRSRNLLVGGLVLLTGCSSGGADADSTASLSPTSATSPSEATGGSGAAEAGNPYAELHGVVVYQTPSGDHESIWLVDPSGANDHQILGSDEDARHPRWSADGEQLVYSVCPPSMPGCTLNIAEPDGSNTTAAYDCGRDCFGGDGASLSPDGHLLAFTRYDGDVEAGPPSHASIAVGPPGGPFEDLTYARSLPSGVSDQFPRWSPDGEHLVFFRERIEEEVVVATAVFMVDVDGRELGQLTPWKMNAGNPDWSPDGSTIVFNTNPLVDFESDGISDVYSIRPDGTGLTQLTDFGDGAERADQPTWADDGDVIMLTLMSSGGKELWAMRADGSDLAQITTGGLYTHPQLQPR